MKKIEIIKSSREYTDIINNSRAKIIDNNEKVVHNGYDYVIIIKKGILELTYKEMEKELLKLISIGDKIE